MWYGWLVCHKGEREFLEKLGVTIVEEVEDGDFQIEIDSLDPIDKY